MIRFIFIFLFVFLGCNKTVFVKKNNSINRYFLKDNNNTLSLNKEKIYIIKDSLIIPENKVLIINNNTIVFKKRGLIVNNGTIIFGEKKIDSLFFYNCSDLDYSKNYNIKLISKNKKNNIINNGFLNINNTFFDGLNIISNNNIIINNSIIIKSNIKTKSNFSIYNSYIKNTFLELNNCEFILNNTIINNNNFIINNSNSNIKNSLINNNSSIEFNNCINNNIINNVVYNNKNPFYMNINNGFFKLFNNIFLKNDTVINNINECQLYIINNTFDNNKVSINSNLKNLSLYNIISKNNIYSNNNNDFILINNKITHTYSLSNSDILNGYYNIYDNPNYIDVSKFDYNLNINSSALRHATNNINIGANINKINNIKYLK